MKMRGKDVDAPTSEMTLGGEKMPLRFDMETMRIAEDVYEQYFGRNANFADILQYLAMGKIGGIMAILYGALRSAGAEIAWRDFTAAFRLTDVPGVREQLQQQMLAAMPPVSKGDKKGDPQ